MEGIIMKRLLLTAIIAATPLLGVAQVNFNFSIGDPNYNGQIFIDNGQQPDVLNETPITGYPGPYNPSIQPIYLNVPLYVYEDWSQYCRYYGPRMCYKPVYFVDNDWYQNFYIPWYVNRYPNYIPKYQNRYPNDVPKYQNRYPNNVPKYAPAPRESYTWHGIPQERNQRNSNEVEIQRDERRY
jgi:hypothetical protein